MCCEVPTHYFMNRNKGCSLFERPKTGKVQRVKLLSLEKSIPLQLFLKYKSTGFYRRRPKDRFLKISGFQVLTPGKANPKVMNLTGLSTTANKSG
jgi:hypothetical protein